jgi:hypothetical protein
MASMFAVGGLSSYLDKKFTLETHPVARHLNMLRLGMQDQYVEYEKDPDNKLFKLPPSTPMKYNKKRSQKLIEKSGEKLGSPKGLPTISRVVQNVSSGWSKGIMGIAGAIMFAGYAGGNPSTPVGSDAESISSSQPTYNQEQLNTYQQIPRLSDSNMSTLRQGPRQGYIININGQTEHDNTYARDLISHAVRSQYSNSNINISMNVSEQNEISSEDLYNYFANAL